MFDDLEKNLVVPHEVGMATVQVIAGDDFAHEQVEAWELERTGGPHVHHVTGRPRGVPARSCPSRLGFSRSVDLGQVVVLADDVPAFLGRIDHGEQLRYRPARWCRLPRAPRS